MARVLGVSTDELLGVAPTRRTKKTSNTRIERRLAQIEKLEPTEKRQVLQVLDAFIERGQLKKKIQSKQAA